jgi:hypothetical protein
LSDGAVTEGPWTGTDRSLASYKDVPTREAGLERRFFGLPFFL